LISEAVVTRARQWLGAPPEPAPASQPEPPHQADFAEFQESQGRYVIRRRGRNGAVSEEPISNWVAVPVERLHFEEGGEVFRLRVRLVGDEDTRLITLPAKALVGWRELVAALPSSEYMWTGSDKHVQMLRAHLRQFPTPRRQATGVMGRHGSLIVLPSGTYGPDGPLEAAPLIYLNADDPDYPFGRMVRTAWATRGQVRRAQLAVGRHFPRINRTAVTVPLVGWTGALPWAPHFRERADAWGALPHLGAFGNHGAGKTALGRLLWRLCGIPLTCEPISLATTQFPRLRALAASNLPPVWIDEYRPSGWPPAVVQLLHHELRAVYGGDMAQRGRKDLTVVSFRLRAPILLSGEDWPADPALRERLLAVTPNPEDLKDPDTGFTTAFRDLHGAPLEAFALAYWTWALRQGDWAAEAEAARRWVEALLNRAGCRLPIRAVNNLAIGVFGLTMLQRFLERPAFDWVDGGVEEAVLQQARLLFPGGDRRVALDDLLRLAAAQAHATLRYGHHWVLSGGDVVLRLDAVVNALRAFARQSGDPTEILGAEAYRRQVAELVGRPKSYVRATTKTAKFDSQTLRGVALSPEGLEQTLEIDPDLWRPPQRGGKPRRSG
jgi:DNA primase